MRQKPEIRKIASNIGYLSMQQAVNYVLPLITVPYLVNTIGTERYGLLSFATAFVCYFQVIIDYGFNFSAVQAISSHRADPRHLSNIFFSVTIIKLFFACVCFGIMFVMILIIPQFHKDSSLYFWSYAATVGTIFFPIWFFQGVEEMKYITILNFILKGGITAFFFVFIRKPADYMWVVYLNATGALLVGALSVATLFIKFRITFVVPNHVTILELLRNGLRIFISQIAVTLFTNTNTFILGIFTNNLTVGTYAVSEKIIRAGVALCVPISNAIYPRTILLFKESRERALSFLRKVLFSGSVLFSCVSILLFLFAEPLVVLVTGTNNITAVILIRILSILPLSVFIDNIYGMQVLLNIGGMQQHFLRATIVSGLFSIIIQLFLVPHFGAVGTASSFLLTELLILTLYIIPVRRAGFKLP